MKLRMNLICALDATVCLPVSFPDLAFFTETDFLCLAILPPTYSCVERKEDATHSFRNGLDSFQKCHVPFGSDPVVAYKL